MLSQEQISNTRILIIDDQKLHAYYLEKILIKEGYRQVKSLLDPLEAINAIHSFQPGILVLDLFMPKLDGFQIIEMLNDFRREHYLPILAVTADNSPVIRLKSLQSGATDIIVKPYENIEILFRIRNMIEMRLLNLAVENQNKLLESRVQERTRELRESQLDIIRRLAQAAEFRDNETGLHIIRMSQYCAELAKERGLSPEECDLLLHASPLHDIGKIGIPDSILLKPGPLTEEEYAVMKTHTTIGAKLLSDNRSPLMKMARIICLTHHEKWDGTGYPQHLKGEAIPLLGQICSVCDVFDALTSARPYKKAWSTDQAAAELQKQKRKSFNPELVDSFIKILPQIAGIKNHHD
jgi:putative two-component system response regulator